MGQPSFYYMTIEALYNEFILSAGICTDTRQEVKDMLFFALKGDNFDGNKFVSAALKKGCRLAISESPDLVNIHGVVRVPSVLETLQSLAHHHRIKVAPQVLAITGSNGKTTTKELVAAVLSSKYTVLATGGNLNNHIGVPLTLLSLNKEEVAVIEMGANHPGEIGQLAEIVSPDIGLITNVGKAHLDGFGSEQGVLDAKGELYDYLSTRGGKAIIDGNDQVLLKKAAETGVAVLVIGQHGQLKVSGRIKRQAPFLEVEMEAEGSVFQLSTGLVGSYNLQNILLAAGVGLQFGIEAHSIMEAIGGYVPDNHRSQFLEGEQNSIILDSYNANPTSMREAIGGLLAYASPPTMLILGDMAELGSSSRKEHKALVEWIESLSINRVLLVGPMFREVAKPKNRLKVFAERSELESFLNSEKPAGYHVLVKGSRTAQLENIIKYLEKGR